MKAIGFAGIVAAALVTAPVPALAAELPEIEPGTAYALDGETLMRGEQEVGLFGIDAPEIEDMPLGPQARRALDHLLAGRRIDCAPKNKDRYGRIVAVCTVGAQDIGRLIVRQGWAITDRRFTRDYDLEERAAAAAGRGLWSASGGARPSWTEHHQILLAGLYAGSLAVIAAVIGAKAIRETTNKQIEENRASEVRRRKARTRGVANLIAAEVVHRGSELKVVAAAFRAHQKKRPGEDFEQSTRGTLSTSPMRPLFQDLAHLAEFAPDAAFEVLLAIYFYDAVQAPIADHTDKEYILRLKHEALENAVKDCAEAGERLLKLSKTLRAIPELAA